MGSTLDFGPWKTNLSDLKGFDIPVAASQYFNPRGGSVIYLDSSGHVTLALTATTTVFGWAMVPHSFLYGTTDHANGYKISSSTAGADTLFVYPFACNPGMILKMPCTTSGAVIARRGELVDMVAVNDGTAQYVNTAASSTDIFHFISIVPDTSDTSSCLVTVNNAKYQADT